MSKIKVFAAFLTIPFIAFAVGCGGGLNHTYAVSGSVSNASSGVLIQVDGPVSKTTTTDANGAYSVDGLPNGQYSITPTQDESVFAPGSLSVTISGANAVAPNIAREEPTEGLSDATIQQLDQQSESSLAADQLMLPNGMSLESYAVSRGISADLPSQSISALAVAKATAALPFAASPDQKKNDVVAKLLLQARLYACGRLSTNRCTTWDYTPDPSNPVIKPGQMGLTYVHGGKTPTVRTLPDDGCKQQTYGMDCSGLIANIAASAGITAPAGSVAQSSASAWSLPNDWQLKMQLVTDGTIQSGDLVAWNGHIGIAETSGSTDSANVISSTGGTGNSNCAKNIVPPRGPRSLQAKVLSAAPPKGLGPIVAVLRMVPKLNGTLSLAASPTSIQSGGSDTLTATLVVPTGTPTPTGNVTFIDQSGATLCSSVAMDSTGTARCTATISSSTSSDTITANYNGDSHYSAASGTAKISITSSSTSNYFVYYFVFQNIMCGTSETVSLAINGGSQALAAGATSSPVGQQCGPNMAQLYDQTIGPVKIALQLGTLYTATFTYTGNGGPEANAHYEVDEFSSSGAPIPPALIYFDSLGQDNGQNVENFGTPSQ
ncbi:hypothetical protein P3T23_006490 [Paraburkholderia sp. GAS448]|uniref:Ig-like domain repeat protein n=1 Tax=Paraburkholderia sp. GAS448 TaxID=3035136 RepID=UPI003D249220